MGLRCWGGGIHGSIEGYTWGSLLVRRCLVTGNVSMAVYDSSSPGLGQLSTEYNTWKPD